MISARFLKFCAVGGLGFLADTGVLVALVQGAGLDPHAAKVCSFLVAVVLTFELNRRWAFGAANSAPWRSAFGAYLGVQSTGFAVNWVVFTLGLALLPSFGGTLIAAAAIASLAALLVNFFGARRFVFRDPRLGKA